MEIKNRAVAGTPESSDAYVEIEPGTEGLKLEPESVVMAQFGSQIRCAEESMPHRKRDVSTERKTTGQEIPCLPVLRYERRVARWLRVQFVILLNLLISFSYVAITSALSGPPEPVDLPVRLPVRLGAGFHFWCYYSQFVGFVVNTVALGKLRQYEPEYKKPFVWHLIGCALLAVILIVSVIGTWDFAYILFTLGMSFYGFTTLSFPVVLLIFLCAANSGFRAHRALLAGRSPRMSRWIQKIWDGQLGVCGGTILILLLLLTRRSREGMFWVAITGGFLSIILQGIYSGILFRTAKFMARRLQEN